MLVEDKSTSCQNCTKKLTWTSHSKTWENGKQVDELTFECDDCHRQYSFKEGKLSEKRTERDTYSETAAIKRAEMKNALQRRCPDCGGPVTGGNGIYVLRCSWCGREYGVINGELQVRLPEKNPTSREMRDFYAIQPRR